MTKIPNVWVIEDWNLRFICILVLVIWDFNVHVALFWGNSLWKWMISYTLRLPKKKDR